jgi:hypothetical protein
MTEYQLAAMERAGEHGEPIFRAPSVGCSGEATGELLKDLRWRINDVRETLMESFGDRRIYGCDEWSTPVVNLQRAIDKIERAIAAQGVAA